MVSLKRLRPLLPWLSLTSGLLGAWFMNRTPGRAWIVVVAAVLGWVMLVTFNFVERNGVLKSEGLRARGARFALLMSNQMAIQQALLFPLPFYLRASHLQTGIDPGHLAFLMVYGVILGCCLWDPLYKQAMTRTASSFPLQAFAVFAGLNMVLPVFGVSNEVSLTVAAAATGLGVPLSLILARPHATWVDRAIAVCAGVVVVAIARSVAPWVPPAPLELVSVAIGTGIENHDVVGAASVIDHPAALICHSAIKAPLGLKDALVHVWEKNSVRFDEVHLDVKGGRDAGFRTWSQESPISPGIFRCTVQTASGQILGSTDVVVR